jgi:hypothetical protein
MEKWKKGPNHHIWCFKQDHIHVTRALWLQDVANEHSNALAVFAQNFGG